MVEASAIQNEKAENKEGSLLKDFSQKEKVKNRKFALKKLLVFLLLVGTGLVSGHLLAKKSSQKEIPVSPQTELKEITAGLTVGLADEKTFRDSAEGKLESGGLDGEGSHHLVRPGGESQYVYLTSSTIDLDKFVGRQVKVWGETFTSQKSGWLMDVGKLKVLE